MCIYRSIIVIIGLLLLMGGLGSADVIPDPSSSITSSTNWVVVNHPATITIIARNTTYGPVQGATVSVALNTTTLGTFTITGDSTTDASGQVSGIFMAGTHPGAVNITATITYPNATPVTTVYTQNIDHDVASSVAFDYATEVTVGTETPFSMVFTDKYGNPIDNRNPIDPHYVTLTIGSVKNHAAFDINGTYMTDTYQLLNDQGKSTVTVLTDVAGGENIISSRIRLPDGSYYVPKMQTIVGVTNAVPYTLSHEVSPTASFPADGDATHKFTFIYTLYDKFGNIAENQSVNIHTTWNEDTDTTLTSNEFGLIAFSYGPHTTAGNVTITATSLTNTSLSCSDEIQYYSTDPVNIAFSVSPDTMPSLDVPPNNSTSTLSAKVMDVMGNPVVGQQVTFSLGIPSYDSPYVSSAPYLSNTTAVTDSNGYARVTFVPGGFNTTDNKYGLFNPSATGSVIATATWKGQNPSATLTWKNYPYLKIKTVVNPSLVAVNDTVSVTISMVGDGWKLQGKPADVVIVSDLAGGSAGTTLLHNVQKADKSFVKNATNTTWIGLVSFGAAYSMASTNATLLWNQQQTNHIYTLFNPYGSVLDYNLRDPSLWNTPKPAATIIGNTPSPPGGLYAPWKGVSASGYINGFTDATIDSDFVVHQQEVNTGKLTSAINNYETRFYKTAGCGASGCGGTDYATGLNAAIELFDKNPNPLHSKTIIIMGDGISMMAPISPGSKESYWPSDWKPRSYYNGYLDESDTAVAAAIDAATRAKAKGITIYVASFPLNGDTNPDTLKKMASSTDKYYYSPDSDKLQEMMDTIQKELQNDPGVNTTMSLDFENASASYGNTMFDYIYQFPKSTTVTWQNGTTTVIDQTAEWNANHQLTFDIGTIKLGETWQTTFLLRAKEQGIVDIFGNNSQVIFNNGADKQNITGGTITIIQNQTNTGITPLAIQITDLHVTQSTPITDFIPLQWNVSYPGNHTATERIFSSLGNSPYNWKLEEGRTLTQGNWTETYSMDVRSLPEGSYYIKVTVDPSPADIGVSGDSAMINSGLSVGTAQKAYIKLE